MLESKNREVTNRETNIRRKIAMVVAILLALAILMAGTFAWQSISQQAVNQAIVLPSRPGGRLHDDFEVMGENFGEREWSGVMTANKDIYVESFEPTDEDFGGRQIFARIRLYEYLETGAGARRQPDDPDFDSRLADYAGPGGPTGEVVPLVEGTVRTDRSTWIPRIPEGSTWNPDSADPSPAEVSDLFRAYFTWGMGGQKWFMPTFNRDHYSLMSDTKGDAVDPQHNALVLATEPANPTRSEVQGGAPGTAFPPEAGLHDFFDPANPAGITAFSTSGDAEWDSPVKYWDFEAIPAPTHSITTYNHTHAVQQTANATVMTMAEWVAAGSNSGPYWVIDEDGWAYWAQPIAAGTATGLLIDYISLVEPPEYEVYYAIFANAQFATATGWMSEDDAEFGWFNPVSGPVPSAAAVTLMQVATGTLTVATTTTTDAAAPAITTTSLPNAEVGAAYSQTLTATGVGISWSVISGDLPDGLTLDAGTGVISGTPIVDGTFTFTVQAENGGGTDTAALSIEVNPTA